MNTFNFSSIRTVFYRGRLDSCNYSCSYCAFQKIRKRKESQKDVADFARFCGEIEQRFHYPLRVMLIPYGEGMIHSWYRQGMYQLAALPQVEGISGQTNLSFPVDRFLDEISRKRIPTHKIKLWCSFHPEMVPVTKFIKKVETLREAGIELCTGVVGVPDHLPVIRVLREKLHPSVYLFINEMEGRKEKSTPQEINAFSRIDPLFNYDCKYTKTDFRNCRGGKEGLFINHYGSLYACPRSPVQTGNLYKGIYTPSVSCGKQACDCYIAYSNLRNHPLNRYMGSGIIWRIPERKPVKAIFFDIDGTLVIDGKIPKNYIHALKYLAEKVPLFLATALPVSYARRKLGRWFELFSGGIYADGAHIHFRNKDMYIPVSTIPFLKKPGLRTVCQKNEGKVYKYSITTPGPETARQLKTQLDSPAYNLFQEGRLVTIVDASASKKNGLESICRMMDISTSEVLAIGDTLHDLPMLLTAGYACAVQNAEEKLKNKVPYILNPDQIPAFFGT